jgi:hypothetical protein
MKKEEKITITIREDGKLTADADNFSGDVCMKELQKLLEGFPAVENTNHRPDFYKKDPAKHAAVSKQL